MKLKINVIYRDFIEKGEEVQNLSPFFIAFVKQSFIIIGYNL